MRSMVLLVFIIALAACTQEQADSPTRTAVPQTVWPQLELIDPSPAIIGEKVTVVGRGGYLEIETEAGIGYDESSRSFQLYLVGDEVGEIVCFVNRCEGEIVIPAELVSGKYELSAEGGSNLTIDVIVS
jgi:hypothetical protein